MTCNMTPVEVVERMIGPPGAIAAAIGMQSNAAYAWRKPGKWRDAGDIPSTRVMRLLLSYAAARRIPLTSDHLIWGAKRAEVEALLSQMPEPQPVRAAE